MQCGKGNYKRDISNCRSTEERHITRLEMEVGSGEALGIDA